MPDKRHFLISITVHGLALSVFFASAVWTSGEPERTQPQKRRNSGRVKSEWSPPEVAVKEADPPASKKGSGEREEPVVEPRRIQYVGAPQRVNDQPVDSLEQSQGNGGDDSQTAARGIREADIRESVSETKDKTVEVAERSRLQEDQHVSTPTGAPNSSHLSITIVPHDFESRDATVASDVLADDGVKLPGFKFDGFGLHEVRTIVQSGQGVCVAFCDEKRYLISGDVHQPDQLTLVAASQLSRVSQRAIEVPATWGRAVATELEDEFAVKNASGRVKVRLLISMRLDSMILERQKQAARELGADLEDVLYTVGRCQFRNGCLTDYLIDSVALRGQSAFSPTDAVFGQSGL